MVTNEEVAQQVLSLRDAIRQCVTVYGHEVSNKDALTLAQHLVAATRALADKVLGEEDHEDELGLSQAILGAVGLAAVAWDEGQPSN